MESTLSSSSSEDPLFCKHCGVTNPYGAERCFNCNQRLGELTPMLGFSKMNVPPAPPEQAPPFVQPQIPPATQPQAPPATAPLAPPPEQVIPAGHEVGRLQPPSASSGTLGQPVTSTEIMGWSIATLFIWPIGLILPIYWMTQKRPGALACLLTFLILGVVIPASFVGCIAMLASLG